MQHNDNNATGGVMLRILRNSVFGLAVLIGLFSATPPASAAYPDRPVHWMIGFAAGGPVDIVARIMAQWLSDRLGQQFIVENRAGSGGNIAAAAAINAPADGYTLLFVAPNNAISTSLYKKLPYDFLRDTVPVASIMQLTNMLVVSNAMPVKTVQEFIDYCKANPGKISFASSGNGTSVHMSAELFKVMTKCDMVHVPYRGSAIAFPDIISNKVQLIFDNLPSALEQAKGGNVRALGVTSPQRWPGVPDVPAIAEIVPGFESVGFYGISAPKGTPGEVVEILNKAVGEALKDPKLVARLAETGGIPKPMTPAEFGKLVADETEKWRKVVEFAGVSVD
ncbi:tripartite tricarboxylate transporter substrate binding protein [Bradyrhizobium niftali]|jgi:tripartite-type tricarboxylate transporter receptor subunit TctC|uniref:Tripartite tricarboxylate transporter substrate binding protein n=2 Tax=Bradyrhizobium niftali TaxID=2560055 RepID=A0A4Y9LNC6_9BRAD|nr:tripartite tricarboxylate transporter substrate binding protein [Bradyrhizobium niftali]